MHFYIGSFLHSSRYLYLHGVPLYMKNRNTIFNFCSEMNNIIHIQLFLGKRNFKINNMKEYLLLDAELNI